jgi:predicted GH43/DUF377 family glycosyl hydrolase
LNIGLTPILDMIGSSLFWQMLIFLKDTMIYPIFVLFCLFTAPLSALFDLDRMEQSFIVETKQLHIPGYPDAFNPSIVRWKNGVLLSFRAKDPSTHQSTVVGFVWLDNDFNPIGTPQLLKTDWDATEGYIQDPRLIVVDGTLYMAYSDLLLNPLTNTKKRTMCVARLKCDHGTFQATDRNCFFDFDGDKTNKFEKNWVPFDYEGMMLLSYTISPHKTFLPRGDRCANFAESAQFNPWKWGVLRGGTTAIPINDQYYLAFFHSSTVLETVQSEARSMPHYFMGAYLFENKPPFEVKKISPEPIVASDFYNGEMHQTWKPLRVVFPCGFIFDKDYIWVSYGRQDHEAWIVKLDKAELFKSLVPFNSNP